MRVYKIKTLENPISFKRKLFLWAQQFKEVIWLDSNNCKDVFSSYDAVLAVDAHSKIETSYKNAFKKLKNYNSKTKDYIFGYLGYDLKNDIEKLFSLNTDNLEFPDLYFFQPKKIFFLKKNTLTIAYLKSYRHNIEKDFLEILKTNNFFETQIKKEQKDIQIEQRILKEEYFNKLAQIKKHIEKGDAYEINFCQEFYIKNVNINPLKTFKFLNKISAPPFATYLKLNNKYLLSASPERFIKKENTQIISQPIKGTSKKSKNKSEDKILKKDLLESKKERAENIMIVDLIRNDLSNTATKGSVKVKELCKLYTFKQVHHLISTITSNVLPTANVIDIIKSLFPMGSMTGAPKIAAMKIIENLEETKRGVYSGAVGYITPQNDFDFNVVIRSILYNKEKKYASFTVGGAITSKSNIEKEYKECLIKADALIKALKHNFS